jgi:glycerophosphoryl diester phosphodiesterase
MNPTKPIALVFFFTLSLMYCGTPQVKSMKSNRAIELHGHRGARGLKPENTIPAFEKALELGVYTLELDIVLTKDKQILVHHDTEVNPQLCVHKEGIPVKKELISNLTLFEVQKLDCGSIKNIYFPKQETVPGTPIPTLTDVIRFVKGYEKKNPKKSKVILNIELKFPPKTGEPEIQEFVSLLVKTLEQEAFLDSCLVQSFDLRSLPVLKELKPNIPTSALFYPSKTDQFWMKYFGGDSVRRKVIDTAKYVGASYVSPYYGYINSQFVEYAHSQNLKVLVWTVNTKEEMQRLHDLGVDGIISDYPDYLKELFY